MNAKKLKKIRKVLRDVYGVDRIEAWYHWVKRPDGSIVRQLNPLCSRAGYQAHKGRGVNRVQTRRAAA